MENFTKTFFVGLVMAVVQGGYVRRVPITKTKSTTVLGFWLIIPSFIFVGLANSAFFLYLGLFLYALCKYFLFFSYIICCMKKLLFKISDRCLRARMRQNNTYYDQ